MARRLSFLRLREGWMDFGGTRKFLWASALGMLLVLVATLLWMNLTQREYRVLFSGLSDQDGGQVLEALEKLRIPYQLGEPVGTIEVPADQLHMTRYRLAVTGLPKSAYPSGADPANEPPAMRFGLSSFQEQAAQQRTLEAELARSIEVISGIASARVHLALPRQSAFLREPVLPSASVLLKQASGTTLTPAQVEAVRVIVASSVPGLRVEQVNVLDQHGALPSFAGGVDASMPYVEMPLPDSVSSSIQTQAPTEQPDAAPLKPANVVTGSFVFGHLMQNQEVLLGLLAAALLSWLWLRVRARRASTMLNQMFEVDASQSLDMQLGALRQRVVEDPRLAASVVKLWMQET